jgi:hypothetical protein
MRNGSLLLAVAALCSLGPRPAEAGGPADPCSFITRRNHEQCLGKVLVTTRGADDEVVLDGAVVGKGPVLLRDLEAGKHVVEVRSPGVAPEKHAVIVLRGRAQVLHVSGGASLTRAGAPPLSEASFGYTDECDGIFIRHSNASTFPVDPDRLVTLRREPALSPHLPTIAAALGRAETACDAGDAAACRLAGEQANQTTGGRESNFTRAAGFFRKGCDLHDRTSCAAFADNLDGGYGVPRDEAAAAALRERVCAQGDAVSCGKLGHSLAFNKPSPKAREQALPFLQKACAGGDWHSCDIESMVRLRVACDRGDPVACKSAGQPPP